MQPKAFEEKQQGVELSWACDTSKVEEIKQDMNYLFPHKNSDNTLCQSQYNIFGYNEGTPQLKNISTYDPNHGFFKGNQQLHISTDMSSSSTCSHAPMFTPQPFLSPKVSFPSLFSPSFMNPYDSSFDFVCDAGGYLEPLQDMHNPKSTRARGNGLAELPQTFNYSPNSTFDIQANYQLLPNLSSNSDTKVVNTFSPPDLQSFEFVNTDSQSISRANNVLNPIEKLPQVDKDATIFQRRMAQAHLQNSGDPSNILNNIDQESGGSSIGVHGDGDKGKMPMEEVLQSSRKSDESGMNSTTVDGSGLVHTLTEQSRDQSENVEGNSEYGWNSSNNMGIFIGDNHKSKRKGPPAKNLMAERRRRKKLSDRLYTLRSIVPNISKMDRASILSDAVEYVKMLLQRIDDLRKEMEATPVGHTPQPSASLDQLITSPSIIRREEHCPTKLSSPVDQHTRVEVREKEGMSLNIHMYCAPRPGPGLLLSTMKALENIGLDVQQAVISCLNGFTMDIFHAEHSREGPDMRPEQIRAILIGTVGACPPFMNQL